MALTLLARAGLGIGLGAAAWFGGAASAQEACGAALSAQCAERLGAGAIAADDALCQQQWAAYRACIKRLAESAAPQTPAPSAGAACSEARAQSLWADVKTANDCIAYQSFVEACPGTPEARLAAGRMRRLDCAAAAAGAGAPAAEGRAASTIDIPRLGAPEIVVPEISRPRGAAPAASDAAAAQRELRRLGLYQGAIDGDFGPASQAALRRFEARQGIVPVDGKLGPTSLAALKAAPTPTPAPRPTPGATFRDCAACPEMVVIPGGSFTMGSPRDEPQREPDEGPRRTIQIEAFAIGVAEVSFAEWDACVADGGCRGHRPDDEGWGRGDRPVINVSWEDAQAYARWLNGKAAGAPYRLPSEAEWEYAARAGTATPFWWGGAITPEQANYRGDRVYAGGGAKGVSRGRSVPVRRFAANRFGLHQVHGNVREWVRDCKTAYGAEPGAEACRFRGLRGGGWNNGPWALRAANRFQNKPDVRNNVIGFRIARAL